MFGRVLVPVLAALSLARAQSATPSVFTDPETGIVFNTWTASNSQTPGGLTMGLALPSDALTTDADEVIGYLQCSSQNGANTGWCGVSFDGSMTQALLLLAYPYEDQILTSLRFTTGYDLPAVYAGDATVTTISSVVNETHYTLIYRCQGCLAWDHNGNTGSASTTGGYLVLGWAQAFDSPTNPECPGDVVVAQHDDQYIWGAKFDSNAMSESYAEWTALATGITDGECAAGNSGGGGGDGGQVPGNSTVTSSAPVSTPTATTTAAPVGTPVPTGVLYDYIIVGSGAGGIPMADKLSESGASVLLIEKGPVSSGRWGGEIKPDWLDGTNLTRFDVPGLCNEIWADSAGIACTDTDQMAGCVLGGGTAVNAGLWWKPNPGDWDYNFPEGWKASDMTAATERVFSRIPGTEAPSRDGELYRAEGFNVVSQGLLDSGLGWSQIHANEQPDLKNRTLTHTPYMYSNGERGGPMATYLVSASARDNFALWTDTAVRRVIRTGGHITGVEVEASGAGGYSGVVNITSVTGRVILSAGTFGSAKILMRSGIGPDDMLAIVANSTLDGATMIAKDQWIPLPVGSNLEDHTSTDVVFTHPDVVFYDFYAAFDDPIENDMKAYLDNRTGILAQAAPNIGPLFFEEVLGGDGKVRSFQYTARVEGSGGVDSDKAMTISQYLGRGAVSRGRMTINAALSTVVSDAPYLKNTDDVEAVIASLENLQASLSGVANLTWAYPAEGTTMREHVENMLVSYSNRRSNHWIGTSKMGTDDGRIGGSAVVDTNAKVWGTDNLFVVDAGIFPGMVTTNPSAYIVVASEHAAEKILAMQAPTAVGAYGTCGGRNWTGSFTCQEGFKCVVQNEYYSQCVAA